MAVLIKLCGMTRAEDIQYAAELRSDFFGVVVEVPWSKRSCAVQQAAELFKGARRLGLPGAALFCEHDEDFVLSASEQIKPFAIQLQGKEPPEFVANLKQRTPAQIWKAVHVSPSDQSQEQSDDILSRCVEYQDAGASVIILDTMVKTTDGVHYGGTGQVGDWETAALVRASLKGILFLAGGLNPENVVEAIAAVQPDGVDLASGIESTPGIKDSLKMGKLVANVHRIIAKGDGTDQVG